MRAVTDSRGSDPRGKQRSGIAQSLGFDHTIEFIGISMITPLSGTVES